MSKNKIKFNNFKPFGGMMQSFSQKPITLIYGPNSIGKSSLIHLMAYRYEVQAKRKIDMSEIREGDTISLGGFSNFVHRKNINNRIELSYPIKAFKENDVELYIEIGIDNERVDILKISYSIDNEILIDIYDNRITVNIEHDFVQKWINEIIEQGKWSREEMEKLINNSIPIQKEMDSEETVWNYLQDTYKADNWTGEQELYKAMNNFKERLKQWTKKDEESKQKVQDYIDREISKIDDKELNIFAKWSVYDEYYFDTNDILSIKNILLQLAYDNAVRINTKFWSEDRSFLYIGPLRFYPERNSLFQEQNEKIDNNSEAFWNNLKIDEHLIQKMNDILYHLKIDYLISKRKAYYIDKVFEDKSKEILSRDEIENNASYIEEVVFIDKRSDTPVHNREMGLGVTQLLPVLASSIGKKKTTIAVEQPELHLHPKLQAEIADEFIRSYKENKNEFLIETHSEYLLLRIMKRMRYTAEDKPGRDKSLDLVPDDVCVLYIDNDGESTYIQELRLSPKGKLLDHWPNGFFEEGFKERFS